MTISSRCLPVVRIVVVGILAVLAAPSAASAASPTSSSGNGTAGGRASFIVTLRPDADADVIARDFGRQGVEVSNVYRRAMSGFAGQMSPATVDRLRRDPRVLGVERDGIVRATATQANAPWGLDRVDQASRPLDGSYTYDTTGSGVTVYVVDSGIRSTHVDLGGRVAAGYTAINDGRGTADCNGHGTHVAGTIAGSKYGTAKAATIVPVRVLGCDGSGTWSGVIAGIDWITAHHPEGTPAVANLSLGGDASSSIDTAVRNSIADGVTYVAAAGNSSVDACTASPGRVPEVLTVAATTSSDVRASYSNFGSCVDLFAPGSGVTSTYHSSDTATAMMSGTSMASPHVAGIAALYLAAAPGSTPATVHAATVNGATPNVVTDVAGSANRLAFSRLATTAPTLPTTGTPPATPGAPTATAASKAVSVSWSPPGDGGTPLTGYTVRVHKANGGKVVKTVAMGATTTTVSVGGLRAGVSFYATLQATNAVGSSAWSPASRTVVALR